MDRQRHLWFRGLDLEGAIEVGRQFIQQPLFAPGLAGNAIGVFIEKQFRITLQDHSYDVPLKSHNGADLREIHVDVKSVQMGRRKGAPKFHATSTTGTAPTYGLLIFSYEYDKAHIRFLDVYYIPPERVTWKETQHFIFSLPQWELDMFKETNKETNE